MARRHEDALSCLERLLERHEANPGSDRRLTEQVSQAFPSLEAETSFRRRIAAAETAGAVQLEMDRGDASHLMKRVILKDAAALYRHLGRSPRQARVLDALRAVDEALAVRGLPAPASEASEEGLSFARRLLEDRWSEGRSLFQISAQDVEMAVEFLAAAAAGLSKAPGDARDLRSYSRQVCGDSKLIERQMSRIVGLTREMGIAGPLMSDAEVVGQLGLEKFPHLVEIAGHFPGHAAAFARRRHFGLHPDLAGDLDVPPLRALITIENYASFNRYVQEVMQEGEAVLYTGGWPGRGEVEMIRRLAVRAERVLHWGDIDMAGAAIADAVWRASEREIELHLMEPELAVAHGRPATARRVQVDEASPAARLVSWLASPQARVLEQEEIDPVSVLADCRRLESCASPGGGPA